MEELKPPFDSTTIPISPFPPPSLEHPNCSPSPSTSQSPPDDPSLLTFDHPLAPPHPLTWPRLLKLRVALSSGTFVFVIAFSSSAFAPARGAVSQEFSVDGVVSSLGVSLFIIGFAIGPLFFAPLSEVVGHAPLLWTGLVGCAVFQVPMAVGRGIGTVLAARLLQGIGGAALMSVGTGMFAEVFEPVTRGVVVSAMAGCMNLASAVSPVAGGYVVERMGWRWIGWLTLIMAGVVALSGLWTVRETSPRLILLRRAKKLRKQSEHIQLRTKYEDDKVEWRVLLRKYLLVPVRMFWTELILVVLTVYLTFVYGMLYLAYQMFPISFARRGWSPAEANLPFIAVCLGIITAWGIFAAFTLTWYKTKRAQYGTVPEYRLPPMILGSFVLPASLLWFGWSDKVHWMSQVIACYWIGLSLQLIFMSGVVFIVDVYGPNSNCAMSIQVVFRSLAAASFPLWSPPMYASLGVSWSATVLAGFAFLMMPFPMLFMRHGERIRSSSKYAMSSG
jgi:MFS transporter, DHA1 family, multidrug resistance protein